MDNTVGSLRQQQKSLIIGSILGDGYIRTMPGRANAFLEINHSYKAKDYVNWKHSILKDIVISKPTKRKTGFYLNGEPKFAYRFSTKQHKEISKIETLFYKEKKKIIPKDLSLDSLSLAVWFMDDGSTTSKGDVYINTQQFSLKDQRKLLHILRQFDLRARLNKDKQYYRIRFLKESIPTLKKIIKKHIIPSMEYKIKNM